MNPALNDYRPSMPYNAGGMLPFQVSAMLYARQARAEREIQAVIEAERVRKARAQHLESLGKVSAEQRMADLAAAMTPGRDYRLKELLSMTGITDGYLCKMLRHHQKRIQWRGDTGHRRYFIQPD